MRRFPANIPAAMEPESSPAWTDAGVGGCPGGAVSEPFLLVVAGEANSGRSTFLGALFGEQVGGADVAPAAGKPMWFRYGGDAGDLWEGSGFPGVEDSLREHVGCFEARLVKMRNTLESARRVLGPGPAGSGDGAGAPAKGEPPGFARARRELEAIGVALDRRATPDGEHENSRLSAAPGFR